MRKRTLIVVGILAVLGVLAAACELSTIGGTDIPLGLECEQNEVLGFNGEAEDAEIVCLDPVDALTRAMRGLEAVPSEDAEECVTTERFYSDGTSEINAYGPGCPDGTVGTNASAIGGTEVPTGLNCAEDEVIAWAGVDGLGCVHYEAVTCDALFSSSDAWRNGQDVGGDIAAACDEYTRPDGTTMAAEACTPGAQYDPEQGACAFPDGTPDYGADGSALDCPEDAPPGYENGVLTCVHIDKTGGGDGCGAGHTWQGSNEDGYTCVPMAEFEGRTGWIDTGGQRIVYHTEPCADTETALPPPFADVVLCVDTAEWQAAN